MDFAQMQVTGPDDGGSTYIDLTYSYLADNTWYCPSVGKIGATSGIWTVGRLTSSTVYLYSGDALIATADGVRPTNAVGYPFRDDMLNMVANFTVYPAEAEWSFSRYAALISTLQYCTWQFNSV